MCRERFKWHDLIEAIGQLACKVSTFLFVNVCGRMRLLKDQLADWLNILYEVPEWLVYLENLPKYSVSKKLQILHEPTRYL